MLKTAVPFIGFQPAVSYLPTYLKEIGFKPLADASPEDFNTGAVILLFNTTRLSFVTVIVRYTDSKTLYYSERVNQLPHEEPYEAWMESSMKFETSELLYMEIS